MKPILKKLPNGLRVLMIPMKDNPAVTAMVLVAAGSEQEKPHEHGLAHFLEHMCFKGTKKRPSALAITRELEGLGARTNAMTGRQFTGYYAKAQSRHLPKILDIIADIYLNPLFPDAEIEKEKGVVVEEINMYDDMPQAKVDEVFDALLFGDTPQGKTIIGTKSSVRSFQKKDLETFRRKHYGADASVLVIAGAFNPKEAYATVATLFKDAPRAKHPIQKTLQWKPPRARVSIHNKKSEQTHLIMGVRAFPASHQDNVAQQLLASVLGGGMSSRLFQKLREEMGVCYYISANATAYVQYGVLSVSAGVPAGRLAEVVAVIRSELTRTIHELISEEELKIAKNVAASALVLGLETSSALAQFYGGQEIMRLVRKTPKELTRELRAVTPERVRRVAKKLFAPGALRLAVVGPVKHAAPLEKLLRE